ncbi:hypothetical protein DSECCO2_434080 [anaerobic digester metagenome]
MFVGDIPVYTGKQFGVAFICREICVRSRFITILISYKIRNCLKIAYCCAGDEIVWISNTVG